jgi:hypothetical protein
MHDDGTRSRRVVCAKSLVPGVRRRKKQSAPAIDRRNGVVIWLPQSLKHYLTLHLLGFQKSASVVMLFQAADGACKRGG